LNQLNYKSGKSAGLAEGINRVLDSATLTQGSDEADVAPEQATQTSLAPVFVFASRDHARITALATDETGQTLPADYAPWQRLTDLKPLTIDYAKDLVLMAIRRYGFYLLNAE
jgi:hypothetical protein